jgi:hypothetical protein
MYTGLVHLHNFLRWVILLLLIVAIFRHLSGMTGKKAFTKGDRKTGTWLMISANVQFVLGLIQWFVGDWGYKLIANAGGMGAVMKNAPARFWVVEHPIGMLIAVALISIGRGVAKKNIPDPNKHKRAFWFFLVALILIIVSVPWPGRVGVGRPLF